MDSGQPARGPEAFLVTELLLQVLAAARAVGLVQGSAHLNPADRDIAALQLVVVLGPLRASHLAATLGISRAAATRLIDNLERAGLAHRETDPRDRRAVLVNATQTGRLIALSEIAPGSVLSPAIDQLSDQDRQALTRALEAVLGHLSRQLPPFSGHSPTARRSRRATRSTTAQVPETRAPATSGQPPATPANSPTAPASSDPTITPSEYRA